MCCAETVIAPKNRLQLGQLVLNYQQEIMMKVCFNCFKPHLK